MPANSDRGESVSLMEPLLFGETSVHRGVLTDLTVELAAKAAGFRRSLPAGVLSALADLVRSMNCYYSNLIEGHDTHPIDIERALTNDYSQDSRKRDLQREAVAHIEVQRWVDEGGLSAQPATAESIIEIHRRFCERLPDELLRIDDPDTGERIRLVPGELRQRDVKVGRHAPISSGALIRFLERFETTYSALGKTDSILGLAAAHHRLVWIHPFLDGNGRVARLMSHAMLLESLDTGGIWSIARGLARQVDAYKNHLASCDISRQSDLDGRGHLSEDALAQFTRFFLETCIDQVRFMEGLAQPDRLRARILAWVDEEVRSGSLSPKAAGLLDAILFRGELPRGEVASFLGASARHSRRVVKELTDRAVLVSATPRGSLRLAFPATLASRWMPGLFPEREI